MGADSLRSALPCSPEAWPSPLIPPQSAGAQGESLFGPARASGFPVGRVTAIHPSASRMLPWTRTHHSLSSQHGGVVTRTLIRVGGREQPAAKGGDSDAQAGGDGGLSARLEVGDLPPPPPHTHTYTPTHTNHTSPRPTQPLLPTQRTAPAEPTRTTQSDPRARYARGDTATACLALGAGCAQRASDTNTRREARDAIEPQRDIKHR